MKLIYQLTLIFTLSACVACSSSTNKDTQKEKEYSIEEEELRMQAIQDSIVEATIAADKELQEKIETVETSK